MQRVNGLHTQAAQAVGRTEQVGERNMSCRESEYARGDRLDVLRSVCNFGLEHDRIEQKKATGLTRGHDTSHHLDLVNKCWGNIGEPAQDRVTGVD